MTLVDALKKIFYKKGVLENEAPPLPERAVLAKQTATLEEIKESLQDKDNIKGFPKVNAKFKVKHEWTSRFYSGKKEREVPVVIYTNKPLELLSMDEVSKRGLVFMGVADAEKRRGWGDFFPPSSYCTCRMTIDEKTVPINAIGYVPVYRFKGIEDPIERHDVPGPVYLTLQFFGERK